MLDRSKVVSEMRRGAKRGSTRFAYSKQGLEAPVGRRLRGKIATVIGFGLVAAALLVACAPAPSPTVTPSPEVKVEASPSEIYLGGEATLEAGVGGKPVSDVYSCIWGGTHEGLNSTGCRAIYTLPSTIPPGTKIGITVYVCDAEGHLIGSSSVDITVSAPSSYHYLFVLDASERMAQKLNGETRFERAKGTLEEELDYKLDNANVGLRVFGYTEEPSEYCKNTELLVEIAPGNKAAIKERLAPVGPQREAPLHKAIGSGLNDLQPEPGGSYFLILIIGGPDTCEEEELGTFIERLPDRIPESRNVELHTIAVTPSEDDAQALAMLRDQLREVIPSTFYYSADDLATLGRILDNVTWLGAPDPLYQSLGYDELREILQEQGDILGSNQMLDHSLELVPDANESLYQRGLIWGSLRTWEKANQDFTVLIAHEPREYEAYFLRGVTWYNLDEYELAEMDFSKAGSLNPSFALAEYARGLSLARLGQPGAQDAFRKAFIIEPNLFASPYFGTVPSEYKVPSFYETATPSELFRAGQDFFDTPTIFETPKFLIGP